MLRWRSPVIERLWAQRSPHEGWWDQCVSPVATASIGQVNSPGRRLRRCVMGATDFVVAAPRRTGRAYSQRNAYHRRCARSPCLACPERQTVRARSGIVHPHFRSRPVPGTHSPRVPPVEPRTRFSCGYLVVPENRTRPNGRTIKIAVARAKARSADPRPDPLLYLTGGPGGPGLPLANGLVAGDLNRDRDLIIIDQRGTLHAQPALTCPEIDDFTAAATGMSIQAPSTAEKDLAAVRACRDRLAAAGTDLAAFDTSGNASESPIFVRRWAFAMGTSTACPTAATLPYSCFAITPTESAASSSIPWRRRRST